MGAREYFIKFGDINEKMRNRCCNSVYVVVLSKIGLCCREIEWLREKTTR